ncbi:MAG: phosphoglucosamine mutase [bacterium]
MQSLFGTDGIRGQANRYPITPELTLQLGKALGKIVKATGHGSRRAIIGKDTRLSGYMLETALTSGLVSMGVDVLLVGPVPTPAVAHLTRSMAADIGFMLTASHNPFDDNGIKIFGADGFKLPDASECEITRLINSDDLNSEHVRSDQLGKAYRIDDARGRYIEFAKSTVQNTRLDGIKLVLDCANGAAYHIAPLIFRELGATVVTLCAEPDGYNINNNCGALHPDHVAAAVLREHADLGIALDGDADRVIFCDAAGHVVDGDRILAMLAIDFRQRGELVNNTIVCTTMSNLGLYEALHAHDIKVVTSDVGDRQVIETMRSGGYNVGGEKSGHLIFMRYATTGDGIISALQLLCLMKRTGATLNKLTECMSEYPQTLLSLPIQTRIPLEKLPKLQAVMAAANAALKNNGRIVVRYSGTENKIRLLVEASDEKLVKTWIDRLSAAVHEELTA